MFTKLVGRGATVGAVIGVFVVAAPASAATLRGVVVHRNHHAGSFVVALPGGRLAAVHARHSPKVGRNVRVSATRLRNGTFAANKVRVGGRARHAVIRGVVTFVNRRRGLFTVSSRGASVLIHRSRRAGAADALPTVGENVTVQTGIDDQGDLQDDNVQDNGNQSGSMDLSGTVLAVDPTARTLSVSSDDDDQSGQALTVHVPSAIDISAFTVGEEVELVVTLQTDGSFLLQGSASDDNTEEANNPGDEQGKQESGGDHQGSGEHGGSERLGGGTTPGSGTGD
jgi:hypothetical protein